MPKVGSQTVEDTLRLCGFGSRILRIHFLSAQNAREVRRCIASKESTDAWRRSALAQLKLRSQLLLCLRIRRMLSALRAPIPKIEVITAVRDVLGTALSSIFQNYRLFVPSLENLTAETCQELLLRPKMCAQIQSWFDMELKPHLGVDVFEIPFCATRRHQVYETAFARVLLYRFDALPSLGSALEAFLGCRIEHLSSRNRSDSKEYAEVYQRLKSTLALPAQFVEQQLKSRLMRHFYADEEREALARRWAGLGDTVAVGS